MNLERLEVTPLPTLLGEVVQTRLSGFLTIVHPPRRTTVFFAQGMIVLAASNSADDSFARFLEKFAVLPPEQAQKYEVEDPRILVPHVMQTDGLEPATKQPLLRDWLTSVLTPLFSLSDGTAFFNEEQPLEPDHRIFIQSTSALVLQGVRSISNGLVLRKALGDVKREIVLAPDARRVLASLALTDQERAVVESVTEPITIERLVKRYPGESMNTAHVVIALMALGLFVGHEEESTRPLMDAAETQREMTLLATIGNDPKLLRVVGFARRLKTLDHYQVLDVPRASTRNQIVNRAEELRDTYDPLAFPPAVRDEILEIRRRIDEALSVLTHPAKRPEYDQLLAEPTKGKRDVSVEQRLARHALAEQNFVKAQELALTGDYYGAIVLLQSALEFAPSNAEGWFTLATCQEKNPKWRYQAVESYQKAIAINPNHVDALIGLGDIFQSQGMVVRAENCYLDAVRTDPENVRAKGRLKAIKK
ncbi:MAG: tetratricopeptide repeat protein [Thermoanaerobaculia bacterium]